MEKLPVRPQKVRSKYQMHPGELYEGWACKNCGGLIAAYFTRPGSRPIIEEPDDYLAECTCPHCQTVDRYRWNARQDLTYPVPPPSKTT